MSDAVIAVVVTLLASALVGMLFRRIGIPGGMMLGGIVGAACLKLLTNMAYVPPVTRFLAQSIAGGFLGASLERSDIRKMPRLLPVLLVVLSGIFVSDLLIGILTVRFSPIDPMTALMSGVAGGMNDIPLIADEMGAEASVVAVLQFVRLLAGIGLFPLMIRASDADAAPQKQARAVARPEEKVAFRWDSVLALVAALAGGAFGKWLGIPAGSLIFSTLGTMLLHICSGRGKITAQLKQIAQLFSGAYIGCMIDRESFAGMKYLLLPAMLLVLVFAINCLVAGLLIPQISSFSRKEGMLCATLAGAGEIALISSDLNIDNAMLRISW